MANKSTMKALARDIFLTLAGQTLILLDKRNAAADGGALVIGVFCMILGVSGLKDWIQDRKETRRLARVGLAPQPPMKDE